MLRLATQHGPDLVVVLILIVGNPEGLHTSPCVIRRFGIHHTIDALRDSLIAPTKVEEISLGFLRRGEDVGEFLPLARKKRPAAKYLQGALGEERSGRTQ